MKKTKQIEKKIDELKKKKVDILPPRPKKPEGPNDKHIPPEQNPENSDCVNCNLMEIERQIEFIRGSLQTKDSIKVTSAVDNIKKELNIIMGKINTWYE